LTRRRYGERAVLGIGLYLLLALAPLILMLLAPLPPGRSFLRELSVALGFAGASVLGLQLAISARLRRLKAPYGIDAVYHFHRRISYLALALVLAHPTLLFIESPATLALLNVVTAPWRARLAVGSVLLLLALIGSSLRRKRIGLSYEAWRGLHDLLAVAVLVLAVGHMEGIGHYINAPWKRVLWIAYPVMWLGFLGYVRLAKPVLKLRRPYRITQVRREAPRVWTLGFHPEGHPGIKFLPGQFAWVTLRRSPFSFEEHPFSFSSSAEAGDGGFEMTVKELGDFTSTIGTVKPGETAYLDGPYGAFTTDRYPAGGYVFIAGGIGITPIMSLIRTAADRKDDSRMRLLYAASTVENLVFSDEIDTLTGGLSLRVTYILERPPEGWKGERGFMTRELLERNVEEMHDADFFICGPPPMMTAVEKALSELRVRPDRIHYERFDLV